MGVLEELPRVKRDEPVRPDVIRRWQGEAVAVASELNRLRAQVEELETLLAQATKPKREAKG